VYNIHHQRKDEKQKAFSSFVPSASPRSVKFAAPRSTVCDSKFSFDPEGDVEVRFRG
jgi:hypothetical protein